MKLFIDDIRDAPEGWTLARTVTEAIRAIYYFSSDIDEISIDHDISHPVTVGEVSRPYPCEETFAGVAYFIAIFYKGKPHPKITIHSGNIIGAENIAHILGGVQMDADIKLSPPAHRKKS